MFEEEERRLLINLYNINRRIRVASFSYLNFLSIKTDGYKDNYFNYKYDINNENKNINISSEEILKRNENYSKMIEKELSILYEIYSKINEYFELQKNSQNYPPLINRSSQDLLKFYENHKIKSMQIIQSKDIIQKSDLFILIFKNMINLAEDSIIRESVKTDRKLNYFFVRNKYNNKLPRQINDLERQKNILDDIKGYIKSNFKNSNIEISIVITSFLNKNYSKFRVLSLYTNRANSMSIYYNQIAQINIKLFPLNIALNIPLNKEFNFNIYKYALYVKDEYKIFSKYDSILFKKIKMLFNERITSFLNLIYEDKKRKLLQNLNNSPIFFDEDSLKELLKKFINYISDYNNIYKTKCSFCENIIKYSLIEKCFFPPFYKVYREKENIQQNKIINENDINLFFHEECFRKIANKYL